MKESVEQLYSLFQKHPHICTDTRDITKDSIFFALKGENFDGNTFAEAALEKGSVFAVVDEEKYKKDDRYILVEDVLKTLQELARLHRKKSITIPVIGITGSNGKTTTKELVKAILDKKYKTFATVGNLNNHIGVPLSILSITPDTEIAVIEIGTNSLGEIAFLSSIAKPTFGLITNIGEAHLEGLKNEEEVGREKSNLFKSIRESQGVVFVNKNDEGLMKMSQGMKRVEYEPRKIESKELFPHIEITSQDVAMKSHLFGEYNIENIAAALCVGDHFEVPIKKMKEAIEEYKPTNNRSQIKKVGNKIFLLDAYNSNPSSLKKVIESFAQSKHPRKIVIVGDMAELGEQSLSKHQELISLISKKNFDENIFVGEHFIEALKKSGGKGKTRQYKTPGELQTFIENNQTLFDNSFILLKASRKMGLEKLLETFKS